MIVDVSILNLYFLLQFFFHLYIKIKILFCSWKHQKIILKSSFIEKISIAQNSPVYWRKLTYLVSYTYLVHIFVRKWYGSLPFMSRFSSWHIVIISNDFFLCLIFHTPKTKRQNSFCFSLYYCSNQSSSKKVTRRFLWNTT